MLEPKPIETALAMYASARAELIERIRLRDQVLLLYLGAAAALFGASLATTGHPELLLALPFLALGAAFLVSQHNDVIGSLGAFCAYEIGEYLRGLRCDAPQWDTSLALHTYQKSAVTLRSLGHLTILLTPCAISLAANYQLAIKPAYPYGYLWWFSLLFAAGACMVVVATHQWRADLYRNYRWSLPQSQVVPNPSIERTTTGEPVVVAHVER